MKSETKSCQNCQQDFTIEAEDFTFYEKMKVPTPTWCPECRLIRRLSFWNQRNLYQRKCNATGELIFSDFSSHYEGKVYEHSYWWSDKWDPMEYGREYDFDKSCLEQIRELSLEVPKFSRSVLNLVRSDYSSFASDLKDCYLIFDTDGAENSMYGIFHVDVKDSVNNTNLFQSELCHDCFEVKKSYKVFSSSHCFNCQEVYFSENLNNCNNCFGCVNLRNKSYCIFNEEYSKEEYRRKVDELNLGSYETTKKTKETMRGLLQKFPKKFMHGVKNFNVSGDYITFSKNTRQSFMMDRCENCKYCLSNYSTKDSYDYTSWGRQAEMIYESTNVGQGVSNLKFCHQSYLNDSNLEYCINCMSSSNLFACVGLKHKKYCFLNKQYSKDEYFDIIEKIKQHMDEKPYIDNKGREYGYGEFFPSEFSPYAYNETSAQEYFPLSGEEALKKGYRWKDDLERDYKISIEPKDLLDHISDTDDSITKEVIGCATPEEDRSKNVCTTAFKIIPRELVFYKKHNLPLPRYCPNCRHIQRISQRNSLKLYKRICMKEGCDIEFETTYSPDRKEMVYCESCYQQEVI